MQQYRQKASKIKTLPINIRIAHVSDLFMLYQMQKVNCKLVIDQKKNGHRLLGRWLMFG